MAVTVTVNAETKEAQNALQKFFEHGTEGFNEVTKAGEFLKELGGRLAAAFTVGAIVDFTKEAINLAESLKILKVETGFSIEFLSSLREKADKTKEGFAGITLNLTHFSQALGMAIRQGGESARGFRDLIGTEGLAGFASGGKGMDTMLRDVIEGLNRLPEGAQKSLLAVEMFGRSGREVLPVLEKMRGELEVGFISPAMVEESSKFNETMREIKSSLENIFIVVAQRLLPKLQELADWFKGVSASGSEMSHNLLLLASTVAMEFTKALAKGLVDAGVLLGEAFIRLSEWITEKLDALLVNLLNKIIGQYNAILPKSMQIGLVSKTPAAVMQAEGDQQVKEMTAGASILKQAIDSFFGRGIASARALVTKGGNATEANKGNEELFGPPSPAGAPGQSGIQASVAAEALMKDINKAFQEAMEGKKEMLNAEEMEVLKSAKKEILDQTQLEETLTQIRQTYAKKRTDIDKQQADAQREIQLAEIQGKRHVLDSDPFKSELEKKEQLLALMGQENTLLRQNISIMQARVQDETATPEERLLANKQLQDLQQKLAENQTDILKTGAKGTLSGEMKTQLKELKDEFGTVATQIAKTWKEVIGTAISSISGAITGLITGTETWSQALTNIGTSILNVVIQGLVNMFATMVTGENLVAAAKLAKQGATLAGDALGALFTAISEGGWGAAAIIAAAVAALAVGGAYVAGAFEEGGRPPVGETVMVGEGGPELMVFDRPGTILPADQTSHILSNGGGGSLGSSTSGGGGRALHIHNWFDESSMRQKILNHPEADHRIVKVTAENHHVIVRS